MFVKENIQSVQKEIQDICNQNQIDRDTIQLIAVTKMVEIELMQKAFEEGLTHFGESRVQEFLKKYEVFGSAVQWHFIGHLQTNKVKHIIDKVDLIHSLDSLSLAQMIDKEAKKHNKIQQVLLQVNLVKEEAKYGLDVEELDEAILQISQMKNIQVKGLMFIPPYEENQQITRGYFKQFRQLFVDIKNKNYDNIDMEILSMGMTHDFEIAIEEGSNMIRIGTGIFGERRY